MFALIKCGYVTHCDDIDSPGLTALAERASYPECEHLCTFFNKGSHCLCGTNYPLAVIVRKVLPSQLKWDGIFDVEDSN